MEDSNGKTYTVDWWSNNVSRWRALVLPHFQGTDRALDVLELGSHEGITCNWLMENLATPPTYVCIDAYSTKDPTGALQQRFKSNVKPFAKRGLIKAYDGDILDILRKIPAGTMFDLIYIDQLAQSKDVLQAAVICYEHLRPDGIMVLDDYTHDKWHSSSCPRPGIDAFINNYAESIEVIDLSWQAIIVKRQGSQ
jgi:predicted O-methyltransferase YrrM